MFRADLHVHSTCSDGTCTPSELLSLAKKTGLAALAITDHDTLDAYTEALFQEALELGIRLFTGIEFSTRHNDYPIHILGYGIQKTPKILAFCQKHQERRLLRNRAIIEKLQQLSINIEEGELGNPEDRTIGRPHIAALLVAKGIVNSIQEAFDRFLGDGKSCFEAGISFSVQETIEVIHEAGGKVFIAHPHLIEKGSIFNALYRMDFDGIECYYGRIPAREEKRWLKIAKERGWLISGGSDFHGSVKPHISLGCSWVAEEEVIRIFGKL